VLQHGSTIYHRLGRHATPAKLMSRNNPTQQADRLKLLSMALEQIAGINPHLNRSDRRPVDGQVPSNRRHPGLLDPERQTRIGTGIGKADISPAHFAHARLARLANRDEQ
jgi:hypothetical protein